MPRNVFSYKDIIYNVFYLLFYLDGIECFSAGGRRVYDSENSSFALSSLESAPKWATFVRNMVLQFEMAHLKISK